MSKFKQLSFYLFLIMFLTLLLFSKVQWAEAIDTNSEKSPLPVPESTSKVKIDGVLNEKTWENALHLELNYEVEPGENITPPVKTDVFLTTSNHHLYVAFQAHDPEPSRIRARFTDRDNIWEDDYVGIALDTFNDSRVTYNFYCNPLGIQAEKVISVSTEETPWDAIWNSAGRITQDGYIVEMEIPFSALRFQRTKDDQVWGIDAVRSYPRSLGHLIGLFLRDRDNNCLMCQAEKIVGFSDSKPGKDLEFDPTLSAVLTQERESFPEGEFKDITRKINPGLTARWRFTPNLTLSGAVNPDFSHVEADAAQLDVNNQFVLYYPEKRPFFLEDGNLFSTFLEAIYTRRVSEPDWGIKLTGKEGKHSIGFFSVRDSRTIFVFPWSQGSSSTIVEMENMSSALRYRLDVGKSSAIGFTATDREGDEYYNRVVGIDGELQLTKKNFIYVQWLNSWTQYPDQVISEYDQPDGTLDGNALYFFYGHRAQKYGWALIYQRIAPEFRADLGTNSHVDYQFLEGSVRYTFRRNPGHWFTTLHLIATYDKEKDTNDVLNYDALYFDIQYIGPMQSFFDIRASFGRRSYLGKLFDENFVIINTGFRPSGKFYAALQGTIGDRIDFANVQAGTLLFLNPIIEYKAGKHLTFSLDHVFERLKVAAGRLYTANLSNFKMVYQFNRRTFLRAILQYANIKYSAGLYSFPIDPEQKSLFSQILFSYKINPQTVLFLGYSDDYYGFREIPLKQNNRTFFLKIGYALVL